MKSLFFLITIVATAGFFARAPQNPSPGPIPAPSPSPDLNGHWQDSGRAVLIVQNGSSVTATFEKERYICDPRDGRPPQDTPDDFKGTLSGRELTGELTVCSYGKGNKAGTGLKKTAFKLTLSPDGKLLFGTYRNLLTNHDDDLRIKRGDCEPQYRLTTDAVVQAIIKACKERHIPLPSYWEPVAVGAFVRPLNIEAGERSLNGYPNAMGFLIPLEGYSDIWLVGSASAPCMGSGDGSITVELMLWSTRKVDGQPVLYGMIEKVGAKGQGLDQNGLNKAIGGALDAAKLNRFKTVANPGL